MADTRSPEEDKAELALKVLAATDPTEISTLLEGHDDLKDELANDPEAFIKKYSPDSQNEPPAVETPAEGAEPVTVDDEVVEVKLPKKFLGTYKDGESLLKGMSHKDEVINTLRQRLEQVEGSHVSLKKLLAEKEKEHSVAPLKVEPTVPSVDFDLEDSADLFEEGNQKKLLSLVKAVSNRNKELEAKINQIENNVTTIKSTVETDKLAEMKREQLQNEAVLFEAARKNSGVFQSERPIAEIENEYITFLKEGSRLLGYDGTIYDAAGVYTEGAKKAFALFNDEKAGADFRAKIQAAGISYPTDLQDLQTKAEIERIRNREVDGKYIPVMSWDEAITLYGHKTGITAKQSEQKALEQRKAGAVAHAKAVQNRQQFASEVRPSEGAHQTGTVDMDTLGNMIEAYARLVQTGKEATRERETLTSVLVNGGMDKAEVDVYLSSFKKKE